jgi:hypothetical protein
VASVTPDTGAQGQTLDVQIVGAATHFLNGTTYATFGDGIVVHSVTVQDQTHATANVSVSPTATLGWRQVQVVTGGEIATILPTAPLDRASGWPRVRPPALGRAEQRHARRPALRGHHHRRGHELSGRRIRDHVRGWHRYRNIQVADATHLTVTIAVTALATPGLRAVVVTTGGEVASLADSFTVIAASPPALSTVTPNSGKQGESLSLTLAGSNTQFTTGQPTLTLGSNITVDPLVVVNDTTITASVAIDALAVAGSRQGILSAGGTNFPFAFTVTPSAAAVASVTPASGPQGGVITVTVSGNGTHWQQGSTTAVFPTGCQSPPAVSAVTVNSATQANLTISIPANACVGSQLLRLATGGEVLDTTFGVYAHTPSLTIGPASAMIGSAPTVNLLGEFTHFGPATTAIIDGAGVTIENFTPAAQRRDGHRQVRRRGDCAHGAAHRDADHADRWGCLRGRDGRVRRGRHAGHPDVCRSVPRRPRNAGAGDDRRPVHPFRCDDDGRAGAGHSGVRADDRRADEAEGPGGHLGGSGDGMAIGLRQHRVGAADGRLPHRRPRGAVDSERGAVGRGAGPVALRADHGHVHELQSDEHAHPGCGRHGLRCRRDESDHDHGDGGRVAPRRRSVPNTVLVLTDTAPGQIEVATGAGFNVGRGPSNLLSVTPNVVAQNQIVNVSLVGQGTHWLHGGTTADFGPGITVAQLAIQDPTHATAQLVLLAAAALGFPPSR